MARRSKSNCRWPESRHVLPLALLLIAALAGCASTDGNGGHDYSASTAGPATPHLDALREYLEKPPEQRPVAQERLRAAAEKGGSTQKLQYALALSTHLDDPAALTRAREIFEALLTAPEPLPVALDGLVRLQLASIIDRIERLAETAELRAAERSCYREQRQCEISLTAAREAVAANREELESLRRKLAALTRIEQSVNDGPEERNQRRDDAVTRGDPEEENHATPPSDSSRR